MMNLKPVPQNGSRKSSARSRAASRRAALVEIFAHESYLTRRQLVARLEIMLGIDYCGYCLHHTTFENDIRAVRKTFSATGEQLLYSRDRQQPGYYLKGHPALSNHLKQMLQSSAAEIDPRQIEIYCQLTPAERFYQGCSISDTARQVVAYRILQENPGIEPAEANRLALQRAYSK